MLDLLLDRLGDWNPQLFRELKSRLNIRSITIVVTITLLAQGLIWLFHLIDVYSNLPEPPKLGQYIEPVYRSYCTGAFTDGRFQCLRGTDGGFQINWEAWWQWVFRWTFQSLTIAIGASLLIGGSFLLTSDLVREGRRGNLNFLRLSPQSATSIFLGKLLGVPIWLYLGTIVALPFHLWLGTANHIPLVNLLGFYVVLAGNCAFFYSLALLAGLLSLRFRDFQPWLCSGGILGFQVLVFVHKAFASPDDFLNFYFYTPAIWASLFSPVSFWVLWFTEQPAILSDLGWFYLPVGKSSISLLALTILNAGICTYSIWRLLVRRFHNPQATLLSKRQSYWLVFGVNLMLLGFAISPAMFEDYFDVARYRTGVVLAGVNGILILSLIVALTPDRPALQDWASHRQHPAVPNLWQDLAWGEKSPALAAIALNLVIMGALNLPWILPALTERDSIVKTLMAMAFLVMILLIGATIVQLLLLMKTRQRSLWMLGTLAAILALPPLLLHPVDAVLTPEWFLISPFPWYGIAHASLTTLLQALGAQVAILAWLTLRLTRQLKHLVTSDIKRLISHP